MSALYPTQNQVMDMEDTDRHPSVKKMRQSYGWPIRLVRAPAPRGFRVSAGCRWFTLDEALKHWGRRAYAPVCFPGCIVCKEDIARAQNMLRLVPKMAARACQLGWMRAPKKKRRAK